MKYYFLSLILFVIALSGCVALPGPSGGPECYVDNDCSDYGENYICDARGDCSECPVFKCTAPPNGCWYEPDDSARCPGCGELVCETKCNDVMDCVGINKYCISGECSSYCPSGTVCSYYFTQSQIAGEGICENNVCNPSAGSPCEDENDCPSAMICENEICKSNLNPGVTQPTCYDNKKNGQETGVDCGGLCPACNDPNPNVQPGNAELYGSKTKHSCDYYASPNGNGNGLSQNTPFLISDFWNVNNIAGKTLCLVNGEYKGINSLIQPPIGLSGEQGKPITIVALYDGKVFINGEGKLSPVFLDENNWFVLEGFNVFNSSQAKKGDNQASVTRVEHSTDVTMKRIVGWHAANGNTGIFSVDYSRRIIREDCAGFGQSRTPGGNGHRSDTKSDTAQGKESNNILRRFWGRTEYNTWGGQKGISIGYNTNGNIVENSIITFDGHLEKKDTTVSSSDHFGFHQDRTTDNNNQILGSIFYRTADQVVTGSSTNAILTPSGSSTKLRDILVVVEGEETTYGNVLKTNARLNRPHHEEYEAKYLTFIGGSGIIVSPYDSDDLTHFIVQRANWNEGASTKNANINPAIAIWSPIAKWGTVDYAMVWDNKNNWNVEPVHNSIEDPKLIEKFGNLLQYGTGERPKVDGQPVGAQIQCRYENGELTNKPLWPWPMEERIRVATCMYDEGKSLEFCEQNKQFGVQVTKTIFELGGGEVPNFEEINPIVCPGN